LLVRSKFSYSSTPTTLLFISSLAFDFFYLLFLALHFVSCVFLQVFCAIKAPHFKMLLIFFIFETITFILCCGNDCHLQWISLCWWFQHYDEFFVWINDFFSVNYFFYFFTFVFLHFWFFLNVFFFWFFCCV
jgi:hypothetical protein